MSQGQATPFSDLPAALVDDVIQQTGRAAEVLLTALHEMRLDQANLRSALEQRGLVQHESDLGYAPLPTTCGIDGSYAIERLLATDLAAAAAVAIEGLTPPSETRFWEQPHHSAFVTPEPHHEETSTILRAVMLGRELLLACEAPHDLVMLDFTLTLPIIYFNQALNLAPKVPDLRSSEEFLGNCVTYLEAYRTVIAGSRSDHNFVGLPKYSTRREIGRALGWPGNQDDRGLLTFVLRPGDLTSPVPLEQPEQPWHFNLGQLDLETRALAEPVANDIVARLSDIRITYYKPQAWLPALRLEMSHDAAGNRHRLGVVVQGIKHQCATASMLEPYPLYLADRTVKALARALPTFRQVATQHISEHYQGSLSEVFLAMHGYRSEGGK